MPILDLQSAPHLDRLSASICVIGSGPAGGILAVQIASTGLDVLLLEAGALLFDTSRHDSIQHVDLGDECSGKLRFCEQLGGSSNRWGGRLAPLDDIDLECRDWVPLSGWPISDQDIASYCEHSCSLLGVPDRSWSTTPTTELGLKLPDQIELRCYQWARRRYNARTSLSNQATMPGSSLRILLNAPVQRLVTTADRARVEHVEVMAPDGRVITAEADVFVLAAGAIQTPRLLLNSMSDHAAGLGDEYGNVGRYFATHPRADIGSITLSDSVRLDHPLFRTEHRRSGQRRYCIAFSRAAQAAHGLLNHHVQLLPFLENKALRLFENVKRKKVTQTKMFDRRSRIRGVLPGIALSTYRMMERATGLQGRGRGFMLRAFLDQYPDRDNRVYLTNTTDMMGLRQAAISWRFTENDRRSVLAFLEQLDAQFAGMGIGHVDSASPNHSHEWPMMGIHSHFMGTTRMGTSPKTSVTDKHGRLHQTSNLFIAGPSLFPTPGSANPFFMISALSLRLADHIRQLLSAKPEIASSHHAQPDSRRDGAVGNTRTEIS